MAAKKTGLSRDFLFHPGETLREVIEVRGMTQRELALRTGFSAKHVSEVLNGIAPISVGFASKLEYALGVESEFWMNLQSNYDIELWEIQEFESISEEELQINKNLKEIAGHMKGLGILPIELTDQEQVIALRKILGIGSLTIVPQLPVAAFRASKKNRIDIYVLALWVKLCEIQAGRISVNADVDIVKLTRYLPQIKQSMFDHPNDIREKLIKIFSDCGIKFVIVKHFTGAPVQGFIEKTVDNQVILCMTIRNKWADIFWFTLFHEIGHIINGDIEGRYIDYVGVDSEVERAADLFARDNLLDPSNYSAFVRRNDFSRDAIRRFAAHENVQPCIVIGRLQNDKHIPHSWYNNDRVKYVWEK